MKKKAPDGYTTALTSAERIPEYRPRSRLIIIVYRSCARARTFIKGQKYNTRRRRRRVLPRPVKNNKRL